MDKAIATQRWWEMSGDAMAREAWAIAESLRSEQQGRRRRAIDCLRRYEGMNLKGLYAAAYNTVDVEERAYAVARSMVDTLVADIGGEGRPKPQFITSGADWKVRRRAKKLDRFVEATLCQPQGQYCDAWDLAVDALLVDGLVWGCGVIKVIAEEDRVGLERTFMFELYVDPLEARYRAPLNLFHSYYVDLDKLIDKFGDDPEVKAALESSVCRVAENDDLTADTYSIVKRVAQCRRIVEAWRLPLGKDKPGKHAFVMDDKLLHVEDYDAPDFPFVIYRYAPERVGFWSRSLIEEAAPIEDIVNDSGSMMNEKIRICSGRRVYYREQSVAEEHLEKNDAETFIPVQAGAEYPHEVTPEPLASSEIAWWQNNFSKAYELPGMSQMMATGSTEGGITSAIGMRTKRNLFSKRFAMRTRSYENCFVDLGRKTVRVTRDLANENKDFAVRWPGRRFVEEIPWHDVNLEEDQYEVRIDATTMLQREAAGILSTAQELRASGDLSSLSFKRIVAETQDLENELDRDTAESEYIERMIDRYLDADEETWRLGDYESPDGHIIDKPAAMIQLTQAYFEARCDDAPEFNLELLRRYIKELDAQLVRANNMQASAAAAATPVGPSPAEAALLAQPQDTAVGPVAAAPSPALAAVA